MQPLGGKTKKGKGRTGGFWGCGSQSGGTRRSGIALNLSGSFWQGRSQKPGARNSRPMLSGSWRVATFGFIAAAAVYGLSEGGYFNRSAQFASKKASTLIVRAGFAVDRVTIEGQVRTKDAEIIHALGLDEDTSTLGFNTASARARLEKLPLVRRAQVMRLLPSQLHVVLEERVPYAIWQHNAMLRLVDQDGTVIETLKERGSLKLPLVVGAGAATHARELLDELALWPQVGQKVEAAVRVADRRWNLKLVSGMEIRLPEDGSAKAIRKIAELDKSHKILSGDAVSVDMRLADRITIRLGDSTASRRESAFAAPAPKPRLPGRDT